MKQVLVILRGASATGKSTIAGKLRNFDKKIVWLKTDNFKPFFSNNEERALDDVMDACLATLNYLLDTGYSVIYEGIFKRPEYAQKAMELGRSKNIATVIYQLSCSLDVLKERDKTKRV